MNSGLGTGGGSSRFAKILGAAPFAFLAIFMTYLFSSNTLVGFFESKVELGDNPSVFNSLLKPLVLEPEYLSISKIGLKDVKIIEVGVEEGGRLGVPGDYFEVGWYKNGPKAGEEGNAILAGHFDTNTGAPAIFYNLTKLAKKDLIEITDIAGKVWSYEISEIGFVSLSDPFAVSKAYSDTKDPILTLITCGGVWDPTNHDYNKRLIIKAKKVS